MAELNADDADDLRYLADCSGRGARTAEQAAAATEDLTAKAMLCDLAENLRRTVRIATAIADRIEKTGAGQ
jgi:hypothetical protein